MAAKKPMRFTLVLCDECEYRRHNVKTCSECDRHLCKKCTDDELHQQECFAVAEVMAGDADLSDLFHSEGNDDD